MAATYPVRPELVSPAPPPLPRSWVGKQIHRLGAWSREHVLAVTMLLMLVFCGIFLLPSEFIFIYPGHAGLLWHRFFYGQVMNEVYGEGTQIIWPWDKMFVYDLRSQNVADTVHLLTVDGLDVSVALNTRTKLDIKNLPQLNEAIGPNYAKVVVLPELEAATRKVLEKYQAEQLHSANQEELSADIRASLMAGAGMELINVEAVDITRITLPKTVQDAIQAKNAEQQKNLLMDFRLQEEQKEATRKKIEAEGIKSFQDTLSAGLSDRFLLLQAIQATSALAASPNTKTIIVGGGKTGLPILLGDQLSDAAGSSATPPTIKH